MTTLPLPHVLLEQWLQDLLQEDHAPGTIRRYKSAILGFLTWYTQVEHRTLSLEHLSPISLVGYRNFLQRTQERSTSTVNGHISALRAFCSWLTEHQYLQTNPARGVKLVGRQALGDSFRIGTQPGPCPPAPGSHLT